MFHDLEFDDEKVSQQTIQALQGWQFTGSGQPWYGSISLSKADANSSSLTILITLCSQDFTRTSVGYARLFLERTAPAHVAFHNGFARRTTDFCSATSHVDQVSRRPLAF